VNDILSHSTKPPVIILQGDHGPSSTLKWENPNKIGLMERFSILNAYYLPSGGSAKLFEGISPVNTFRTILNHYFGTNYKILKDRSYFSTWNHPYKFIDVTDKILNNQSLLRN